MTLVRRATLLLPLLSGACSAPMLQEPGVVREAPRLTEKTAVMDDGSRLPLRRWGERQGAEAMLLAVHGFNDYGNAFAGIGSHLAAREVLTYAYDQRGFGDTAQRGRWAGEERMIQDLLSVSALLRRRHPGLPLFLLGESMGGAVVMVAAARQPVSDGVILLAPAVWSRDSMNPLLRLVLWTGAHTFPRLELTGDGIDILPSDNLDMLRAFSADPLVIKGTRLDALWGVTNIMDRAKAASRDLRGPALILYGENDQIIPERAFCDMVRGLSVQPPGLRLVLYRNGWHMLARDLQGERVVEDIATWLSDAHAPLPSGEETRPNSARIEAFCPVRASGERDA